jgi:hypothetical protein
MQQNRIGYYADFAVYPVLVAVMILVIGDKASPLERALALAFALGGAFLWTWLEHRLHRFVLHGASSVARPQDEHHALPRAWFGTPTWLSVAALAFAEPLLEAIGVSHIVSLGIAGGLMAGFLCYERAHHAIQQGGPRLLAKAIAGAVSANHATVLGAQDDRY